MADLLGLNDIDHILKF